MENLPAALPAGPFSTLKTPKVRESPVGHVDELAPQPIVVQNNAAPDIRRNIHGAVGDVVDVREDRVGCQGVFLR